MRMVLLPLIRDSGAVWSSAEEVEYAVAARLRYTFIGKKNKQMTNGITIECNNINVVNVWRLMPSSFRLPSPHHHHASVMSFRVLIIF